MASSSIRKKGLKICQQLKLYVTHLENEFKNFGLLDEEVQKLFVKLETIKKQVMVKKCPVKTKADKAEKRVQKQLVKLETVKTVDYSNIIAVSRNFYLWKSQNTFYVNTNALDLSFSTVLDFTSDGDHAYILEKLKLHELKNYEPTRSYDFNCSPLLG